MMVPAATTTTTSALLYACVCVALWQVIAAAVAVAVDASPDS